MELLITVIGNAAVDPIFREKLLKAPLQTVDEYGFHLSKGDIELLQTIFNEGASERLKTSFATLEVVLYEKLLPTTCPKPCRMSAYPPLQYRLEYAEALKTAA